MQHYLRRIDSPPPPDCLARVGGLIVPFSGPEAKDHYGNYWTRDTDFRLGDFARRPAYYEHAAKGIDEAAGYLDDESFDVQDGGLYAEAAIYDNGAGRAFLRAVDAGRAFFSTAVQPHQWKAEADGRVTVWPLVEASCVARPAAFRGETRIGYVRSKTFAYGPVWAENEEDDRVENLPDTNSSVAAFSAAVDRLTASVDRLQASQRSLPSGAPHPARMGADISVTSKWDNLSLGAMLWWQFVNRHFAPFQSGGGAGGAAIFDNTFYRAAVDKAAKLRAADDVRLAETLAAGRVPRTWTRSVDDTAYQDWHRRVPYMRSDEAMQSDLANYGDELVPTMLATVAWRDMMLATRIAGLFDDFEMPSDPFDYPTITTGPTIRKVPQFADATQATAAASNIPNSKVGTGKVTFTTAALGALVLYSRTLLEDAAIAFVEELYTSFVRETAKGTDYVLLNGDVAATATNISHYGADPTDTAYDKILSFDGLRTFAFDASDTAEMTTLADTATITLGQLMGTGGRYGADPNGLVLLVDHAAYFDLVALDSLASVSDIGAAGTLLTGQVARLRGVPVILPDVDVYEGSNASGYYEDSHDTVLGSVVLVRPSLCKIGRRRGFMLENAPIVGTTGYAAWGTFRLAFQKFVAGCAAVGYNIGGS